jgi:hypothetical protein
MLRVLRVNGTALRETEERQTVCTVMQRMKCNATTSHPKSCVYVSHYGSVPHARHKKKFHINLLSCNNKKSVISYNRLNQRILRILKHGFHMVTFLFKFSCKVMPLERITESNCSRGWYK